MRQPSLDLKSVQRLDTFCIANAEKRAAARTAGLGGRGSHPPRSAPSQDDRRAAAHLTDTDNARQRISSATIASIAFSASDESPALWLMMIEK